jgi:hypothetical protein
MGRFLLKPNKLIDVFVDDVDDDCFHTEDELHKRPNVNVYK